MKYLIPIIFISLSLGIYFFLIKKNTNSTENVTSEIDAKNLMPYKIDKKDYYRYILLNKTTENHLINMIIEYGDLSGNQYYEEHNFEIAELNKWYIIKVPETIDFYVYHNLVGWFNGYEENLNNPQFSIGFSKHKLKSQKDYIFYLDPNNEYGDTHIGNFRDGSSFSIYLPDAYEEFGNLILTQNFNSSFDQVYNIILNNNLNINNLKNLDFKETKIKMATE